MWKPKVKPNDQKIQKASKANPSLQHLSPFASHSSAESVSSSSPSPRGGPELPSGVRYIRQTPTSIYRPVSQRSTSVSKDTKRDKSPAKSLRFADPLISAKNNDKRDLSTKPKTVSTDRSRPLNRPVISSQSNDTKKYSFDRPVNLSPASRQTSPIFSTVDFAGDRKSVTSKPISNGRQSDESSNDSDASHTIGTINTEIMAPNGTVKRSAVMAPKSGSNVHRNTLTIPLRPSNEKSGEQNQNRLSVSVNVAVGLDCNQHKQREPETNGFVEHKFEDQLIEEYDRSHQFEGLVVTDSGNGFALKVGVRLRPFLQNETDSANERPVISMTGKTVRLINCDNELDNRMEYGFDVCLNSSDRDLFDFAGQDQVFIKMGEPLLDRCLEGYNVCLFAYGQTGSGKSYTMMGTELNPGVIPRFVHELYKRMNSLIDVTFDVIVSFYEIYNEKIYDLLSDDRNSNKKELRIREHREKGPYVENLSQHKVEAYDQVMQLLLSGNRRRATASTAANDVSSRSHSIFTIVLSQIRDISGSDGLTTSCSSRINLIDLAGSERVGHSGTSGERLKEGTLINKSLLNLGIVISKLADVGSNASKVQQPLQHRPHIPYRESALTWLLKESLGGNSRTSMIATISPAKCHLEESKSTLRYAAIARRIVNYVYINEDLKSKRIKELMDEIANLRQQKNILTIPSDIIVSDEELASNKNKSIDKKDKTVTGISKSTNTSFVTIRRNSTKGTETSFSHTKDCDGLSDMGTNTSFSHTKAKTNTKSIATNTSFIKKPTTCNTGTEPIVRPKPQTVSTGTEPIVGPKPKTVSTATEMADVLSHATETTYIDLPTHMDLMRTRLLEEEQNKLLASIKKQRDKLLGFSHENGDTLSEKSDTNSEKYYECEEIVRTIETIKMNENNQTFTISEDTVDQNEWTNGMNETIVKIEKNDNLNDWSTDINNTNDCDKQVKCENWIDETQNQETNGDWNQDSTQGNENTGGWAQETSDQTQEKTEPKDWATDDQNNEQNLEVDEWQQLESTQTEPSDDCEQTDTNKCGNETSDQFEWGSEDQTNTTVVDKEEAKSGNDWGTEGESGWTSDQSNNTVVVQEEEKAGDDWDGDQPTQTDAKGGDDWGAQTEDKGDNEWGTEGDNNWNTEQSNTAVDNNEAKGGDDWDETPQTDDKGDIEDWAASNTQQSNGGDDWD